MRYCVIALLALLSACQGPAKTTPQVPDSVPRALPRVAIDLLAYPVPAPEGYQFMGDAKLEVSQRRVFVYQDTQRPNARLQLAIYAIPEGWDDMPATRLVAGHFGQVRESLIQHLLKTSSDELELVEDRLVESEGLPYPLGYALLKQGSASSSHYTLMLSAQQPLFVRMEHIQPGGPGLTPQQASDLMQAVVAQLSGNTQPGPGINTDSNGTNSRNDNSVDTSTEAATAEASR